MVDKIKLVPVTGANNIVNINDNFSKLEKVINQKMLSRKVESGEVNQVLTNLDMNNNRIYNLPAPQSPTEPLTAGYIGDLTETVVQGEANIAASKLLLEGAVAANTEARQILDDTHFAVDGVVAEVTQVRDQAVNQINTTANAALVDMNQKQADVTAKAATVNTQAAQVATNASQSALDAAQAVSSSGVAQSAASTATTQATSALNSAGLASTSAVQSAASATAANTSKNAAAASAVTAKNEADRAAALAGSVDPAALKNRANHTGTQLAKTISNVVGTVSQSGGVPTGGIIQRGSNANGEFVRFADGTQICVISASQVIAMTSNVSGFFTVAIGWTFPAAFSVAPVVTPTARLFGAVIPCAMGDASTTECNYFPLSLSSASPPGAVSLRVSAIGRWF